jgi:hypothetical protein
MERVGGVRVGEIGGSDILCAPNGRKPFHKIHKDICKVLEGEVCLFGRLGTCVHHGGRRPSMRERV